MLDRIEKLLDAVDRRLGGSVKYRLGMRYRKQGRNQDALDAFVEAEQMLIAENGIDHPYVIAAIVRQANCLDTLGRTAEACQEYRRARVRLDETGDGAHPMAMAISEYITAVCDDSRT